MRKGSDEERDRGKNRREKDQITARKEKKPRTQTEKEYGSHMLTD